MTVTHSRYIPGSLWPVNPAGVNGVPGLFAQNERIVSIFEIGSHKLAYIPVGATVVAQGPQGQRFQLTVIHLDENVARLDANHPLAGMALNFDIELVAIG